ncbi:hypothetical protein D3C79_993380 [compost metagenome]
MLFDANALCSATVAFEVCSEPLVLFFTLSSSNTLPGVTPSAFSIWLINGCTLPPQSNDWIFGGGGTVSVGGGVV